MGEEFKVIQKCLKKSAEAIYLDKKNFEEYHRGEVSLKKCKEEFWKANRRNTLIECPKEITDDLFERWLASIGY